MSRFITKGIDRKALGAFMIGDIGSRIGNYRIVRLLGQGNFATVYLGEHISSRTLAAIKLFRMRLATTDVQNFLYDAQCITDLSYFHILPVLGFGVENEHPFVVTSYASGGTLRMLYPQGTRLPLGVVVRYVNVLAETLTQAHNVNLIHGNLKPENILVGQNADDVFLSDFCIETLMRVKSSDRVVGNSIYLAPEQVYDKLILASDQYALGIITYEWLSGFPPYQGDFAEIVRRRKLMDPPSIHEKYAEIPAAVDAVLLRTLAENPKNRFASIKDFASTLEQIYLMEQKTAPTPLLSISKGASTLDTSLRGAFQKEHLFAALPQQTNVKRTRRTVLISLLGLVGFAVSEAISGQVAASLQQSGSTVFVYHGHSREVHTVQWSPDNQSIASGSSDETVQIWQPGTDHPNLIYREHHAAVRSLAWSPDGKYIASAGEDKVIRVWIANSLGSVITYTNHSDTVNSIAWSPDGKYIASGGKDKTVRIWLATDSDRSEDTVYLHDKSVNALAWSSDGKYVMSASDDNTVLVWDVFNKEVIFTKVHNKSVLAVSSSKTRSKDGLAASGCYDSQVHIWDFKRRQRLLTYLGHEDKVNAVLWSPNDQWIISASSDKTVQIWDPASGLLFLTYRGHDDEVLALTQSYNGKLIASGSSDTTVHIWRAS